MLTVERLVGLGRVGTVAVSPDGAWMAVAVAVAREKTGRYAHDLWRVDLVDPSRPPVRLTLGPHDDRAPAFRPDGALLFLSDRPVGEQPDDERQTQVWCLPAAGGEPRPVTDEPLGVVAFRVGGRVLATLAPVWPGVPYERQAEHARERRKRGPTAVHVRRTPVRHWDHWLTPAVPHLVVRDLDGGDRRDLTPDAAGAYRDARWALSPDGRLAALVARSEGDDGAAEGHLHLVETATGALRALGERAGVIHDAPCFSPDGAEIVALAEQRRHPLAPAPELWVYTSADGAGRRLAMPPAFHPREVRWAGLGRGLLLAGDWEGDVPVVFVDPDGAGVARLTGPGTFEQLAVRAGDRAVYGVHHRFVQPPEPFRLLPGGEPQVLARLSGLEPQEVDARAVIDSFHLPGADEVPVHVRLLRPAGVSRPPVLLWIHGGPITAFADGWHWRWNPMVALQRGYAVALPNPRGSTGYGQAFVDGVWNNTWGDACFRDVLAVAAALAADPVLDGSRVAAMGGSFGGYMVNWLGTRTDRFRCLVTHAGLYDLGSFHDGTDEPGWFRLHLGGSPWADRAAFERWSPHQGVGDWVTPTLVVHGERDYRVPVGEGLALFEALQRHGVASELLIFPDEGHWITRPLNVRAWYDTVLDFVDRWMERAR